MSVFLILIPVALYGLTVIFVIARLIKKGLLIEILFEQEQNKKLSISRLFLLITFIALNAFLIKDLISPTPVNIPSVLTEVFMFLLMYAIGAKGLTFWKDKQQPPPST